MMLHKKSNLHYTRDITPKRVTSGGAHLRGAALELHNSEQTSQRVASRWQHCDDLADQAIEPHTSRTDRVGLATELIGRHNATQVCSKIILFV